MKKNTGMCRESERKKMRTNRSGKLNLQGTAAERGSLESVLGGFGVFDAFEEHESVTASGIGSHAVECAVFGEELHQIGVGDVRRQIPHPQIVRRRSRLVEIPHRFRRKRHWERRSSPANATKIEDRREEDQEVGGEIVLGAEETLEERMNEFFDERTVKNHLKIIFMRFLDSFVGKTENVRLSRVVKFRILAPFQIYQSNIYKYLLLFFITI